ncbi:MAG: NAD(+)/NADH kinase [Atopobiaceae bacterium]|nr:NAD(+)/NADH kinase [Atopobiaceae bacterium]
MRVLIVCNYSREEAGRDAMLLKSWLESRGVEAVLAPDLYDHTSKVDDVASFDLVVSLGGDGTLLRAARTVGCAGVPVLGVSYGHLGFLTCAGPENLFETVGNALHGRLHASVRSTLDVRAEFEGEDSDVTYVVRAMALNDMSIGHGLRGDVSTFEVNVSGNHIDTLHGDGFVVATATGSTGYALAAGGPIVTPEFDGMVCVPVAPHTIMARAFLTGSSDVVQITIDRTRTKETCVFADGQPLGEGRRLLRVTCRRGPNDIVLLNRSRESFYDSVSRVFYGKAAMR